MRVGREGAGPDLEGILVGRPAPLAQVFVGPGQGIVEGQQGGGPPAPGEGGQQAPQGAGLGSGTMALGASLGLVGAAKEPRIEAR